jgi:hypothetical protein
MTLSALREIFTLANEFKEDDRQPVAIARPAFRCGARSG